MVSSSMQRYFSNVNDMNMETITIRLQKRILK